MRIEDWSEQSQSVVNMMSTVYRAAESWWSSGLLQSEIGLDVPGVLKG